MRYYLLGTFVRKGGHSNCQLFAELIVPPHTAGILILFMSFPINNYFSLNYLLVCTRRMIFYKSMSMLHIVFVVIIWVLFVVDWLHCARYFQTRVLYSPICMFIWVQVSFKTLFRYSLYK